MSLLHVGSMHMLLRLSHMLSRCARLMAEPGGNADTGRVLDLGFEAAGRATTRAVVAVDRDVGAVLLEHVVHAGGLLSEGLAGLLVEVLEADWVRPGCIDATGRCVEHVGSILSRGGCEHAVDENHVGVSDSFSQRKSFGFTIDNRGESAASLQAKIQLSLPGS